MSLDLDTSRFSRIPKLSIVIATHGRPAAMRHCIEQIRRNVLLSYELVIVAGGYSVNFYDWLTQQPHVRLEIEAERAGCCRAYDRGLRLARGEFVCWLNDDSWPHEGALGRAVALLERGDMRDVGMISLYHTHSEPQNELHGVDVGGRRYGVLHVRGWPYANFGLLRRSLLEELGFLDTGFSYCAWDPDLALRVQRKAGLAVLGLPAALVEHEELADARKQQDVEQTRQRDNARLFDKWRLPAAGRYADPRSAYLAMLRHRGLLAPHGKPDDKPADKPDNQSDGEADGMWADKANGQSDGQSAGLRSGPRAPAAGRQRNGLRSFRKAESVPTTGRPRDNGAAELKSESRNSQLETRNE